MRKLEAQVRSSSGEIGGQFRSLAATLAAAFSVQQIAALADSYTRFTNTLAVNGLEGENLANVQEKLFAIAQRYGVELESLGQLFGRAAQAGQDLGASQAELLQFSEGVSAALKVQGGSAADASGALLQLSQALAGGIVRAEEFNSINEGALPILKAVAANLDGAGGSVAKLRALVLDGKVTSAAFFQAFLAGSEQLKEQAASTTLTIENSFTVLNNALGKYIGEADQSLSATEQISAAIIALSENIDVVAKAIAALSVLLLGRYAASLVAAAGSTGLASAAIFALQARAVGAATTMEALAFTSRAAGASMLAAFGGPVGLAVAALAGAIIFLSTQTNELDGATGEYKETLDDSRAASDRAREAAERLASAHGATRAEALAAAKAERELTVQKLEGAKASLQQARAELVKARAFQEGQNRASFGAGGVPGTASFIQGTGNVKVATANQNVAAAEQRLKNLEGAIETIDAAIGAPEKVAAVAVEKVKKTPKGRDAKGPSGPTAAEIEERFNSELARLRAEQLQAEADLATNIDQRADLFQELLNLERAERVKQIQNDKDFTQAQKDAQISELDRLFGSRTTTTDADGNVTVSRGRERGLLEQQLDRDVKRQQLQQAQELLSLEADALDAQASITFALDDRFALENRVLEIGQEIERQLLEQAIANGEIAEADKARALLAQQQAAQREEQAISQQSPFEQFRQDLTTTSLNLNDALENIGVDALENINDGLVDAIVNFNSLGDVGRSVLRSITAQLVQLALQQILLKTIGATAGAAATAATAAQASATAAAWAPAAAAASLATLGANAGPAAVALATTTALAQALAQTGGLKDGGPVTGPGGPRDDKVLKRLSAGEYVINARATSGLGRQALDYMNATGQLPGMRALGGSIGPRISIPSGMAAPAGGGGGMAGIDQRSIDRLAAIVESASRAMPPVQLFPTIDAGKVLEASLNSPGGQRVFFDFVQSNQSKFSSAAGR